MKALLFLSFLLVSCASIPPPSPRTVFNEYCRGGKQIKKLEVVFDLFPGKCFNRPASVAAAEFKSLYEAFSSPSIGNWLYSEMSNGYAEVTDDEEFLQSIKNADSCGYASTSDRKMYKLSDGRLVFGTDQWVDFSNLPKLNSLGAPSNSLWLDNNTRKTSDFSKKVYYPKEKFMFESYLIGTKYFGPEHYFSNPREGAFWWTEQHPPEVKAVPIANGYRYSVNFRLDDYCQNAILKEDMESQQNGIVFSPLK